ncbi:hypothetical protein RV02_GL002118 [Enterococcus gilvus]|nr:hypothetical protein RV02_GL002118 [Enterococcus gilvus]
MHVTKGEKSIYSASLNGMFISLRRHLSHYIEEKMTIFEAWQNLEGHICFFL